MEICHAYFGVLDEYLDGTGASESKCPDSDDVACPLEHNIGLLKRPKGTYDMTKFCGPSSWAGYSPNYSHFSGTPENMQQAEHAVSCYEHIANVVKGDGLGTIVVPSLPLAARSVPPAATWVMNLAP